MDPRIPPIVQELLSRHLPGKIISEINPEFRKAAEEEAVLLLKILDGLRPPDIMVLANRQIERVSAWARQEELLRCVEVLRGELQNLEESTSEKYEHLKSGLLWAVSILSSGLISDREKDI
jgi:hypothetical protein